MSETTDIIVVGAGPCGLAVGAAAAKEGLGAILIDKGCVTNSIVNYPTYMTFFSTAERLEIEGVPFVVAGGKPTRREALVYYRRIVQHFHLDVRQYEEVFTIHGEAGDFTVSTHRRDGSERTFRSRALVLATGCFHSPNFLGAPGEDQPKVMHYFTDPLPYFDQDVVVVGGGNSAAEAALELYRAGARVTLVHFGDDLDPGVKPWVVPDIRNRLDSGEVAVRWRTRVAEVHPTCVTLRHEDTGETEDLANDWVFAMTGWRADWTLLRSMGVNVHPETGVPEHSPETMETNVPGLYIAGVLSAGNNANKVFIENGREHGRLIVRHLLSGKLASREGEW